MTEPKAKRVKGHGYRQGLTTGPRGGMFVFGCECGVEFGRQPEMSHSVGRRRHREHKAALTQGAKQ